MIATTLKGALKHYTLYRTLSAGTVAWYSRVVSVYCHWAGGDVPLQDFNGDAISRMLLDKERDGRSPYYLTHDPSSRDDAVPQRRPRPDPGCSG